MAMVKQTYLLLMLTVHVRDLNKPLPLRIQILVNVSLTVCVTDMNATSNHVAVLPGTYPEECLQLSSVVLASRLKTVDNTQPARGLQWSKSQNSL